MGKIKEIPRYNVISLRVSDEERTTLQILAKELSINISEMMRSALQHYTDRQIMIPHYNKRSIPA